MTTDSTSYSTGDLNTIHYGTSVAPEGQFDTSGLTLNGKYATKYLGPFGYAYKNFSPSTDYVASDLMFSDMLSNQAHELGHSLAALLQIGGADARHEDPYGARLQDCFNQRSSKQ